MESLLLHLGIVSEDSIEELYPKVRDSADIRVMCCRRSGVIFLSSPKLADSSHYTSKSDFSYWSVSTRARAIAESLDDDQRRAAQFGTILCNRRWLDFGTGAGGILDLLRSRVAEVVGVEPQTAAREELTKLGYQIYPDVEQLPDSHFEVVTLFHVLEHLSRPVETLKLLRDKMDQSGRIIVEVPHARDFLLTVLDVEAFKAFTFWSEHLILHTRQSLEVFLKEAGFRNVRIEGVQRYPIANHLFWLAKGQPGGHKHWDYIQSPDLTRSYAAMLAKLDATDTLIATATK